MKLRPWVPAAALVLLAAVLWAARPDPFVGHGFLGRYWNNTSFAGPPARAAHEIEPFVRGALPAFSAEWTGSLWIDLAGPYQLVVESDDDAWLWVDDKPVVEIPGEHPVQLERGTVRLARGAHALRIRYVQRSGGSYLRAWWRPETSPMFLNDLPLPLERITPEPAADGTARERSIALQQRAVMLAVGAVCALIAAALAAWRARRKWVSERRGTMDLGQGAPSQFIGDENATASPRDTAWELSAFSLALLIRLFHIGSEGSHWDESAYWGAGKNYWRNLSLGDFSTSAWRFNFEHPPIAKWLYGISAAASGDNFGYYGAKALAALMMSLTVVVTYRAAKLLYGRQQAVIAAFALALMPHMIGHGRVAGMEAPSALFFTAAVTTLLYGLRRGGWNLPLFASGLFAALALGTRFTNLWIIPLLAAVIVVHRWSDARAGKLEVPLPTLAGLAAGGLVILLLWPRFRGDPLGSMIEIFVHWQHQTREYFLGVLQSGPPHYYFVYFPATSPFLVLALFVLFLWRAWKERRAADALVLLWLLAPFGSSTAHLRQDGIRYMICIFPPLAIACGEAAVWLGRRLEPRFRRAVPAVGAALSLYLAGMCAWVWPHCIDFYGEHVGGPATAYRYKWFEIGWWGEGIKEAVDFVNANAAPGATVWLRFYPLHEVPALRPDLVLHNGPGAQWVAINNLYDEPWARPPGEGYDLAHVEQAGGAPLAKVYRRR